jgi:drug/metabolite transporter (DMT)-like permease
MEQIWIPVTLAAATFQILRTSLQHGLRESLSTNAAGYVRYLYGFPLALLVSGLWFGILDHPIPAVPTRFWWIITVAGLGQIVGTIALLQAFKLRDFAVGTVYSKTEVILVGVVGLIGLREALTWQGWAGAALVMVGVAWLAAEGSLVRLIKMAGDQAAILGIVAAGFFAVAAVGIRAASQTLGDAPAFDRAILTLTLMLLIQTVLNTSYFVVTDGTHIRSTAAAWRKALPVGILSLAGSTAWAWALTLENAAKVRTLGQIEILMAFAIAWRLGERHTRNDYLASGLVLVGVIVVTTLG